MDNLVLRTKFGRLFISKMITRTIAKKTGAACILAIDKLEIIHNEGGEATVNVELAAKISEKDLEKILDLI